mmetsp:Transcript_38202/g.114290  ORF Transcript_38202/g.114290 Transcript_38202/m.114290 type:complete len:284 (+) Transcript_38202:1304-2155(+)
MYDDSARSSLAAGPDRATNRAPDIATAFSAFHPSRPEATSSCHLASKSSGHPNSRGRSEGSPHRSTSSFSPSSFPSGTRSSNRFGIEASSPPTVSSISANFSSTDAASSAASPLSLFASASASPCFSSPPSLMSFPTAALCSFRTPRARSRAWMRETRSSLSDAMRSAAETVSSEARRERRWESMRGRLSVTVRASGEARAPRETRPWTRAGVSVSVSAAAADMSRDATTRDEDSDGRRTAREAEEEEERTAAAPLLPAAIWKDEAVRAASAAAARATVIFLF